ncbi:hypothetical protein JW905_00440 [bacterium]|nr:hypothetical protein [candidate division CSSED10-310 bacterium]
MGITLLLTPVVMVVLYSAAFLLFPSSMMSFVADWVGTEIALQVDGYDQSQKAAVKDDIVRFLHAVYEDRIDREQFFPVMEMMMHSTADRVFDADETSQLIERIRGLVPPEEGAEMDHAAPADKAASIGAHP